MQRARTPRTRLPSWAPERWRARTRVPHLANSLPSPAAALPAPLPSRPRRPRRPPLPRRHPPHLPLGPRRARAGPPESGPAGSTPSPPPRRRRRRRRGYTPRTHGALAADTRPPLPSLPPCHARPRPPPRRGSLVCSGSPRVPARSAARPNAAPPGTRAPPSAPRRHPRPAPRRALAQSEAATRGTLSRGRSRTRPLPQQAGPTGRASWRAQSSPPAIDPDSRGAALGLPCSAPPPPPTAPPCGTGEPRRASRRTCPDLRWPPERRARTGPRRHADLLLQ